MQRIAVPNVRFNHERPHQGLDMVTPASPHFLSAAQVTLSQVFAGQKVGVKQTVDHIWLVSFMDYDLGYFDDETCRLEPIEDSFGPRLSPMSPE